VIFAFPVLQPFLVILKVGIDLLPALVSVFLSGSRSVEAKYQELLLQASLNYLFQSG